MQKRGKVNAGLEEIRRAASPFIDLLQLHELIERISPIGKTRGARRIKVAIGGNATLNYVKEALGFYLRLLDIEAELYLLEFGTFQAQAFNPASHLYQFRPDIIWHFSTIYDFKKSAGEEVARLGALWEALKKNSNAFILQNNFDQPAVRVFGHLESERGFSAAIRETNERLIKEKPVGVTILDYDWLSSMYGKAAWSANRFWFSGKYPFAVDATALVAHSAAQVMAALVGQTKKCLVLDLDNTLWGGVIAEDGPEGIRLDPNDPLGEAFLHFQQYVLALKERGVILAISSKNEENLANKGFEHPHMLLKRGDFAAIAINWNSKAENLRKIADQCGIRLDSMVFIDDSPFERELVRRLCPEVTVPEMPADPAAYCLVLDQGRHFEIAGFSREDERRAQMYAENNSRSRLRAESLGEEGYLKSLGMRVQAKYLDEETSGRAVQLINKTNQFNLTGERVSESQVASWRNGRPIECRLYRLTDRFGDNGWISAVAFHAGEGEMYLDHWVMSCRVLMRKVEAFIHHDLVQIALSRRIKKIIGRWRPTGKNELVREHYKRLGYRQAATSENEVVWEFDVISVAPPEEIRPATD